MADKLKRANQVRCDACFLLYKTATAAQACCEASTTNVGVREYLDSDPAGARGALEPEKDLHYKTT
jgi:hypothetical protein